jgi:hypothetical protein
VATNRLPAANGKRHDNSYINSAIEMRRLVHDSEIVEERNKHIHKQGVMEFWLRNRRSPNKGMLRTDGR